MKNNVKYSEKELRLIKYYDFDELKQQMYPETLYRLMAQKAFLDNDQSEYAESLRRCLKAYSDMRPYRMTEAWDNLITI